MSKEIQDNDFWLNLLISYGGIPYHYFYKGITVRGLENLPPDSEVILAPNHQNALQDPMAILYSKGKGKCWKRGDNVFLARADIFKGKFVIGFLHFLNILPIYRIRDGFESLGKNEKVFEQAVKILRDKKNLCLMPEGNHGNQRKLRPLVKGLFRIAFMAQQKYGTKEGVKIVPVGIDYGEYVHSGYPVIVNYGKPIEISEYVSVYEENPAVGINKLRQRLADEMRELMVDIRSEKHYDAFYQTLLVTDETVCDYLEKPVTEINKFDARRLVAQKLVEEEKEGTDVVGKVENLTASIRALTSKPEYNAYLVKKDHYAPLKWLLFLLLFPLFLFGGIHNFIPFMTGFLPSIRVKDKQFVSSIRFASGVFSFIIIYTLYAILAAIFMPWKWVFVYILSLIIGAVINVRMYQLIRNPFIRLKFIFGKKAELLKKARRDATGLRKLILGII